MFVCACSAVVDFDHPKGESQAHVQAEAGPPHDGGGALEAGSGLDAGRDASQPDAAVSCELATQRGCDSDQLCCDRSDGRGPSCVDTLGARECEACGQPCGDPAAPHCGAGRVCECEPASGQGCPAGERCLGAAGGARCAECETDDDCNGMPVSKQCVANKCVQCDRGPLVDDASDDQGCNQPARPICNVRNECTGCSNNPDNCPGDQVCNTSLGCVGCDLLRPFDTKNCGGTRPICRMASNGQPQCDACQSNSECNGGYCDSRSGVGTGACTNVCAPAAAPGSNGCPASTPFCKQVAGNEFGCRACTAADCSGSTPFCATEAGPRRGACVACRTNSDCTQSGAPVCDAASGSCRARQATDCPSGSVFDPATLTCIECATSTDCADTPATPICVSRSCVQCELDMQCGNASAPLCAPANHSCVACNMLGNSADAQCAAKGAGKVCVTRGNRSGQCGACDPRDNRGCTAPMRFCFGLNNRNNNPPVCHECDPDDDEQTCSDGNCTAVDGVYRCATRDAGVVPADAASAP